MDFQRRSVASPTAHHVNSQGASGAAQPPEPPTPRKDPPKGEAPKWLRYISVALLFSLGVVVIAIVGLIHYGSSNESKLINTGKYQAVFLANNQVYFGKIKSINNKYVDLQNIFYLNNQSTQGNSGTSSSTSSSLQLVKLGCEVHGPYDEMIIDAGQVSFWENLRDDSQVVTAIGTWQKQNPNGQTCSSNNSTSSTQSSGTTQNSSTDTSSTSNSTSTKKQ